MIGRRLPQIGFALLALATIGAFFLIQALKTANPLIWGDPTPQPSAINPVFGRPCLTKSGQLLNYGEAKLTIAASQAGPVGVYIVSQQNAGGSVVATVTSGTPMLMSVLGTHDWHPATFTWNGRMADGAPAQPGTYYFRIELPDQGRSINLSNRPIQVITQPPHPRILSVRLLGGGTATTTTATTTTIATTTSTTGAAASSTTSAGTGGGTRTATATVSGPPVLAPRQGTVTSRVRITFTRSTDGPYRRAWIYIYRTDVAGQPQFATRLTVRDLNGNSVLWNGKIGDQPAPAGTYLVTIRAQDAACNLGTWPARLPPAPGTTAHAGVTIRYLSVTPPLTPTVSGSPASIAVDSPNRGYVWRLRRAGTPKVLAHGAGPAGASDIHVRMPRHRSGLYTLTVRAGRQLTRVPLVASQAGPVAAHAQVLFVLPMLTWLGDSPVDDSGDGLPDTLRAGDAVSLDRPLVDGPPASFGSAATLLDRLDSLHLAYQLTTDVALAEGRGPSLVDRSGVLFSGGEDFLPAGLASTLRGFVRGGGNVAAFGSGIFRGVSHISGFPASPVAHLPVLSPVDPFGARRGEITPTNGELIADLTDSLGLFSGGIAFSGFSQYQPIQPPSGATVSEAGIASGTPAIVGFRLGSGTVIEVGLPSFSASLVHNFDSQQLLTNVWHVLAKQG